MRTKFHILFGIAVWATTITLSESKPFTINKCCPKGQLLSIDADDNFICREKDHDEYDNSVEDFNWFPMDLIVNSTTLKIHKNRAQDYLKILKDNYEIKEGVLPNCGENAQPQIAFTGKRSSLFHFILHDDLTLKIHISKNNTLHDPEKDFIKFEKVSDTESGHPSKYDIGKLRTLPLADACVDSISVKSTMLPIILYCPCQHMVCIRKCCSDGEFLNETTSSCEKIADVFFEIKNWRPEIDGVIDQYYLLAAEPPTHCENLYLLKESENEAAYEDSDNEFQFFPNGSIKIRRYPNRLYHPDDYCGEATWQEDGLLQEQNLLLCMKDITFSEFPDD